jgi:Ion transport protein
MNTTLLKNFFVAKKFTHVIDVASRHDDWDGKESADYDLTFAQRVFVTIQYPYSSTLSTIILYLVGINIIINIAVYILGSVSSFNHQPISCDNPVCNNTEYCQNAIICAPEPFLTLKLIDAAGIVLFSVDYGGRLLSCWTVPPRLAEVTDDPDSRMSHVQKIIAFICKFDSIVDLASIAPFYFALAVTRKYGGLTCGFIRILRLPRLLHYMYMYDGTSAISALIMILFKSMERSSNILLFTLFFHFIATTLFATIIYVLEGGSFMVNQDYPTGAYLRDNAEKTGLEPSIFLSIPIAVYFTVVTTVTLGYGDFTCKTIAGRAVACALCFLGIIVLALPIAIIGMNFFDHYVTYLKKTANKAQQDEENSVRSKILIDPTTVNAIQLSIKHEDHCSNLCIIADQISNIAAKHIGSTGNIDYLTIALESLEKKMEKKLNQNDECANENTFGLAGYSLDNNSRDDNNNINNNNNSNIATHSPEGDKIKFTPFKSPASLSHPTKEGPHDLWLQEELGLISAQIPEEKSDPNFLPREAEAGSIPQPRPRPHEPDAAESTISAELQLVKPCYLRWFVPRVYVLQSPRGDKLFPTVR